MGWRFFDWALQDASSSDPEKICVSDPHQFINHVSETAITMSDQIPVWLRVEAGKLLTSKFRLKLAAFQKRLRRQSRALKLALAEQVRVTTARKSPGKAPRWRVSFIARQAVLGYFDPQHNPTSRITPSILLVPGSHGRLENISSKGTYIQDETFVAGGQLVTRKAGSLAGSHMVSWRKAREARPELFNSQAVRVWSQPAATADGVIVRWQAELEAAEHRQAINVIDHFAAGWTEEALQTAWLLQRIQTGVPAGCTSLVQVTDVGLAAQAKAALNRWKDAARDRMREKARQEGVQCTYQMDAADLMQAALSMHSQMLMQSEEENTVLRTSRQAGWLHFRPQHGRLVLASEQD
jgi:hypothetical protein